jgi:hypothetical protein
MRGEKMRLNLTKIASGLRKAIGKHSPEILTGIGIAGMITTTVLAVRATPKALRLIEDANVEKEDRLGTHSPPPLTPIEIIKATWKCYVPAAVTGCLSAACLIGASSVNLRRNAALATAYALSESALKEYRGKVADIIGEKKERTVREAIAKDRIDRDPVSGKEVIITEKGNTLCYDALSGRYFKSDIEKLKKAVNELNRTMLTDMYISVNDFYYEIGLSNTKVGKDLGWHIDDGLIELQFDSHLADVFMLI